MPLYDFKCPTCGAMIERFARFGDRDTVAPCHLDDNRECHYARQLSAPKVQVAMEHRAVMPSLDKYDGIPTNTHDAKTRGGGSR
jgi:putative FmdB family regulatory protein